MGAPTGPAYEEYSELPDGLVEVLPDDPSVETYARLLAVLDGNGGSCSVAALARGMVDAREPAARVSEAAPSVGLTERYQSTYLSLGREYLPLLVTLGVVEYDRMDGTVTLSTTRGDD